MVVMAPAIDELSKTLDLIQRDPVAGSRPMEAAVYGVIFGGLYLASLYSYLLFHSLAEIFSIVVACTTFILAWNARRLMENKYLLFVGVAYLFVGIIDLAHTLAYKGMGVFSRYDADLPTQLWIAGRSMESLSLLVAPFFMGRKMRADVIIAAYAAVTAVLLAMIFAWKVFPVCFVEGRGLTPFKMIGEYVICLILAGSIVFLLRRRSLFDERVLRLVVWSIIVTIGSELAFTFYISVYGFSNLVGHFLKIVSFYLIYKAVIETGFVRPNDLLFRNLKLSEEALLRARDELEAKVRERTAELAEANAALRTEICERLQAEEELRIHTRKLEQSNRDLQDFGFAASHDLQEPLRKILAFTDRIRATCGESVEERARLYLDRVQHAAMRMRTIIKAVRSYSNVTGGVGEFRPVDLSSVVREVMAGMGPRIERLGGHMEIGDLPVVEASPALMDVLFSNLIDNGLKFHSEERPVIRVHGCTTTGRQTVGDGFPVELCSIHVEDNGIGFDEKYLDRIFKPFQCLHGRDEYEGIGMGLAVCRKIVELHGGEIRARSVPGRGTTFTVVLPVRQIGGNRP